MCLTSGIRLPREWQHVCQKATGKVPKDAPEGTCSLFLSPNGRTFTSLVEVFAYNKQLEDERLMRENKRMLAKNLKTEKINHEVKKVDNSTRIACNYCRETFFNMSMLKLHEKRNHYGIGLSKHPNAKLLNEKRETDINVNKVDTVQSDKNDSFLTKKSIEEKMRELTGVSFQKKTSVPVVKSFENVPKSTEKSFLPVVKSHGNETNSTERPAVPIQFTVTPLERNFGFPFDVTVKSFKKDAVKTEQAEPMGFTVKSEPMGVTMKSEPMDVTVKSEPMDVTMKSELGKFESLEESVKPTVHVPELTRKKYTEIPRQPISREAMMAAILKNEELNKAKKDSPFKRAGSPKYLTRKLSQNSSGGPRKIGGSTKRNPLMPGKKQVTVKQVCKYLSLKDYPVPVTEDRKKYFEVFENFENFCLPLLLSVNPGCQMLRLKTLVKAKWFEVLGSKEGEAKKCSFFRKPRRNKVKVMVSLV